MKPFSPTEVAKKAGNNIPAYVIEAVNNLLVKGYRPHGEIVLAQCDIIKEIRRVSREPIKSDILFDNGWMDFEPVFRKEGWRVTYDQPGYNETYEPTYKFSKK